MVLPHNHQSPVANTIGPRRGWLKHIRLYKSTLKSTRGQNTQPTSRSLSANFCFLLHLPEFVEKYDSGPPQYHERKLKTFILATKARFFWVTGTGVSQINFGDRQQQVRLTSLPFLSPVQLILTLFSSSEYQIPPPPQTTNTEPCSSSKQTSKTSGHLFLTER